MPKVTQLLGCRLSPGWNPGSQITVWSPSASLRAPFLQPNGCEAFHQIPLRIILF